MRESYTIPMKRDSSHGASKEITKKSVVGISFNRCGKKRNVILRVKGHISVVSSPTDIYNERHNDMTHLERGELEEEKRMQT